MNQEPVMHDERTYAVVGTGSRLAYLVLCSGVLVIAAVRALAFGQACWDLLGLVFVSGVVELVYERVKHVQVLPWRWALLTALVAAAVAAAVSLLQRYF